MVDIYYQLNNDDGDAVASSAVIVTQTTKEKADRCFRLFIFRTIWRTLERQEIRGIDSSLKHQNSHPPLRQAECKCTSSAKESWMLVDQEFDQPERRHGSTVLRTMERFRQHRKISEG